MRDFRTTGLREKIPRGNKGYTLIELLLALGLSVAVIASITTAIQLYLISLTKQQASVERSQIARALLTMIERDLRSGIQYKPADYSGLDNLLKTQALAMGMPAPEPVIDEEQVAFRPTLLGTESVLMIDISRLPRLDQYNPLIPSAEDEVQTPSDVKSLAYFFSASNGGVETEVDFADSTAPGGLYRREIDRAVAEFMGETSLFSSPDKYSKLLASEVAQISFRYFDGEEWKIEWDSAEAGGFPMAIEVQIVIDSARTIAGAGQYSYGGLNGQSTKVHRTVVDLPVSEPTAEEE